MNIKDLSKIEFWAVSFIYGFGILLLISNGSNYAEYTPYQFKEAHITYNYLPNYFLPELFRYSMIYFSFLLLNFCALPPLYKRKNVGLNLIIIVAVYLFSGLVMSIAQTYSKAYLLVQYDTIDDAYAKIFFNGFTHAAWMILLISIYAALKNLVVYLMENKESESNHQMKLEMTFGAGFWFISVLVLIATGAEFDAILCFTLVTTAAVSLIIYSMYELIPLALQQPRPNRFYYGRIALITALITIPLCITGAILSPGRDFPPIVMSVNFAVQLGISAPLAWYLYKKRNATAAQITSLKKELGKSDASLGFLKSQINPHFLFNALNTLYGTALQENAERTGEGIQKLGDMMRFMLQENMQDKISLSRDIDYLNNYIELQKLRTSTSVDIVINTEIEEQFTAANIAPMLLIPFVENAFKHGISLQSPSHIKITLQTKDNMLYFDVNNSIHLKTDGDPEKLHSGIGLPNVKQRLNLLYPKKHELLIRESAKEFFVHLTLTLD